MENRIAAIVGFLVVTVSVQSASAADDRPNASKELSIQQQLDELKEGQQRVLQELDAIKRLLQEKPASSAPKVTTVNVHGEPFRGDKGAKVAIMEFSDFECSYCAKYAHEVYPIVETDYIKTGKVKYFFRDLPAPEHSNAMAAAQAARCAGDQGKFWQMHDLLFAAQGALARSNLVTYAQELGLEAKAFDECLSNGLYAGNIRLSVAGAKVLGVYGTPAFVLGTITDDGDILHVTKVLVGGESDAALRSAVDELLAAQTKPK